MVVVSRMTTISGIFENRPWIESCSSAGVPPTKTAIPLGGVIARNSESFLGASD